MEFEREKPDLVDVVVGGLTAAWRADGAERQRETVMRELCRGDLVGLGGEAADENVEPELEALVGSA